MRKTIARRHLMLFPTDVRMLRFGRQRAPRLLVKDFQRPSN